MTRRIALLGAGLAALCAAPAGAGIAEDVATCWNVGALSSEAGAIVVTLEVPMQPDGHPVIDVIRLIAFSGGSRAVAAEAFEVARRAVIRCGADGYDLPAGDYADWRTIQMTFDPSQMRVR